MPSAATSAPASVSSNLPDWAELLKSSGLAWDDAVAKAAGGPRVLLATSVGGGTSVAMSAFESLLAVALTLRGAKVDVLLCDQALPACKALESVSVQNVAMVGSGAWTTSPQCAACWRVADGLFAPLGLDRWRYRDWLEPGDREVAAAATADLQVATVKGWRHDGLPLGEHALAGALRYFARGELPDDPDSVAVLRRFAEAAVLTARATTRLLEAVRYDVVVTSHGLYVPYGITGEVARAKGARVVNWNIAYRSGCFIFSHGETYHHTLMGEQVDRWREMPWSSEREQVVVDYVRSRIHGTQDWIWFHESPHDRAEETLTRLGADPRRPIIGLLTNVVWDAQIHYPANAYASMLDWVHDTVAYFAARPDLQLVIRVHPAEIRGTVPSRQRVVDELARRWAKLPANVFVLPPEERVSTYAVAELCDTVLIFGTKMGVELACFGIPLVVAGEAWIRGKGLTRDANGPAEYRQLLDTLPVGRRLDPEMVTLARRYAYYFFFRRMIPVCTVKPAAVGWPPYLIRPDSLDALRAGRDPGLDLVCRGVMDGVPFTFDP